MYILLFFFIASLVITMDNQTNELEQLVNIYPEEFTQIENNAENEPTTVVENLSNLEFKFKMINNEDPSCAICLQPFKFDHGRFQIKIIEKKFAKDHELHDSDFHKGCIEKWMKTSNDKTCPICRKTLKEPWSLKIDSMCVKMEIKKCFWNPGFWMFLFNFVWMAHIGNNCSKPHSKSICHPLKEYNQMVFAFAILMFVLHRRVVQMYQ